MSLYQITTILIFISWLICVTIMEYKRHKTERKQREEILKKLEKRT